MPAVSKAQQMAAAIAEHAPGKLHAKNRGMLKMSKSQLSEFASSPRRDLAAHISKSRDGAKKGKK